MCVCVFVSSVELLALLKWRTEPEKLKMTLDNLALVPGNEIFKVIFCIMYIVCMYIQLNVYSICVPAASKLIVLWNVVS